MTWEELETDSGPSARSGHTATLYSNFMFIFGGVFQSTSYDELWRFDFGSPSNRRFLTFHPESNSWSMLETRYSPPPRSGHTTFLFGDVLMVFGGLPTEEAQTVWEYDIRYENIPPLLLSQFF